LIPDRETDFDQRLKQGAVFRDNTWKFGSSVQPKYFLVLNRDCDVSEILVVLTTSQQRYYRENPSVEADVVRFDPPNVPFFTRETIINCREVQSLDRAVVKARFVLREIEHLGDLSATQWKRVLDTIRNSRQVPKRTKKLICGGR